jgi:predicted anti-sigma-YlaC factor YlaD
MNDKGLSCQELAELVTEYLEGTLPPAEMLRFENHMGNCHSCQGYLDQMRRTIQLTGMLSETQIAPIARDTLLDLFRDWKKNPSDPNL